MKGVGEIISPYQRGLYQYGDLHTFLFQNNLDRVN